MKRKHYPVTIDGTTYKLRLTRAGQRALRMQYDEPPLSVVLDAQSDEDKMCSLLTQALSWPDSGNPITDGEQLYDLLVDSGYAGPEQFCGLALEIAAASGLMTAEQAGKTRQKLASVFRQAFEDGVVELETGENPTTPPGP